MSAYTKNGLVGSVSLVYFFRNFKMSAYTKYGLVGSVSFVYLF